MKEVDFLIKKHLGDKYDVNTLDEDLFNIGNKLDVVKKEIDNKRDIELYAKYGKLSARYESLSIARSYISSIEDMYKMMSTEEFSREMLKNDSKVLKENLDVKLKEYSLLIEKN